MQNGGWVFLFSILSFLFWCGLQPRSIPEPVEEDLTDYINISDLDNSPPDDMVDGTNYTVAEFKAQYLKLIRMRRLPQNINKKLTLADGILQYI